MIDFPPAPPPGAADSSPGRFFRRTVRSSVGARAASVLLACALAVLQPEAAGGQQDRGTDDGPEVVAREFLDSFRGLSVRAARQRMHPDAQGLMRAVVGEMVNTIRREQVLAVLLQVPDTAAFLALDDSQVVDRALGSVFRLMPGLVHALAVKDVEVVGSVRDASGDTAWAVYRSLAHLSGAETETRVMTLARVGDRWRVLDAPELDVILTALRGVPLEEDEPGDGGAGGMGAAPPVSSPAPRRARRPARPTRSRAGPPWPGPGDPGGPGR